MKSVSNIYKIFILVFAGLLLLVYYQFTRNPFLSFSDGAKYADIGRNLATTNEYSTSFIRFSKQLETTNQGFFKATLIPPLMPLLISGMFRLIGISDVAVMMVSSLAYLLLIYLTFLLGNKYWGGLAGILGALAVASNINYLDYAVSGASELIFGVEIIASIYFLSSKKKLSQILGLATLVLMFFTRAQAPFYLIPIIFYYFCLKTDDAKKAFRALFIISIFILFISIMIFVLPEISITRIIRERVYYSLIHNSVLAPGSDALRMGINTVNLLTPSAVVIISKKLFYNLYNFYKLLPEIASPYMWALGFISLFVWRKNKGQNYLKLTIIFMIIITFLATALTAPLYRYLHPVIPLIYLLGISTLVWIVRKIVFEQWLTMKKQPIIKHFNKETLEIGISVFLVFIFVVGQTVGVIFLDSRFKAKGVNKEKPPVYVELSWKLKEITESEDRIITNLDTWGSWYGERKTVWFPLEPDQLIPLEEQENHFDAIYLTSYLMDDENYYMGDEWRQIFNNPENPENEYIAANYKLKGVFEIPAEDTYEKQAARAVLFVKK